MEMEEIEIMIPPPSKQTEVSHPENITFSEQNMGDWKIYLPLYKAILKGDLDSVRELYAEYGNVLEARITENLDTALHLAVGIGTVRANHTVEYLLTLMSEDAVAAQNKEGNTVLSIAAIVGNVEAAKVIMRKVNLTEVSNNDGWIPLIEAARHGQEKMIKYLLQFSESYLECAAATCSGQKTGVLFINLLIIAGFYDLALDLVKRYPSLAAVELARGESLLTVVTRKLYGFSIGRGRKLELHQYFYMSPRYIKGIRETKALELVKHLCKVITDNLDHEGASLILKRPLFLAAELGICEVVEEIIESFPWAVRFSNEENHNLFHLAVMNRQVKIFNLIFQLSGGHKHLLLMYQDTKGNNILHLAGKLAPKNQLNLIPGAALRMQLELQWFKKVQEIVPPAYKDDANSEGITPAMLFTEAHKELVLEGENWMKAVATSCLVAAALITTVVFGAALIATVVFAADDYPSRYFERLTAFNIFGISDAISLFSAVGAIMMFLSIIMSRYAEEDYLYIVPSKLILGLLMLFLSLISMMVAFGATVYLAFNDRRNGIISIVAVLACFPLYSFSLSQYPVISSLIYSTYGPGIFRRRSTRVLY